MKRTFTGKNRIFLGISGIIIAVALIMQICGAGINLGIDFTGGSLLTYSVGEDFDVEDINTILTAAGYTDFQVTKTEPSEASINLRNEMAAEEAAAAELAAEEEEALLSEETEETEETAEETSETEETAEAETEEVETEEVVIEEAAEEGLLSLDKSGIEADGLTDLQIRLDLVEQNENLDEDITAGVTASIPEASLVSFSNITNIMVNEMDYDSVYAGGYVAEFAVTSEFDADAAAAEVEAYLTEQGYSVNSVSVMAVYEETAEEATEETTEEVTEETAEDATEETTEEATEETTEEATEETTEEATEETTEEATEETTEEATEETADDAAVEAAEEPAAITSFRVLVSVDDQTSQVRDMIETEMSRKYPGFVFVTIDHVSATAGKDLINNALLALLIAFVCMLIYIAIRFDFYSGVVALGALLHDVLIMFAFMVFFQHFFQANSPFIAAVLTIVGYSINNTIIVFDRIRENSKKPGQTNMKKIDIVEMSIGQTLSRTVNTSITTMITLVALYIFGVDSIREFAFPLIVGMLAGTYSSLMLSGQVWAAWVDSRNAKKNAAKA